MDDPGKVFDHLLASIRDSATAQRRRETGKHLLPINREPRVVHLRQIQRDAGEIPCQALRAIRATITGESPWPLFFQGPVGTGKTCAALWLLDHVGSGWYWTIRQLCRELIIGAKEQVLYELGGDKMYKNARQIWHTIGKTTLVVLDELGTRQTVSDFHFETVQDVLDGRIGKPLVVISNLFLDELTKVYDDRIVSRICAGTIVEFTGADKRL